VAGAKVKGFVKLGFGDTEEHDTITDARGQFSFIGLHGQDWESGYRRKNTSMVLKLHFNGGYLRARSK